MILINLLIYYYSALFLTTAVDKIIDFKGSIIDVSNYNIIPEVFIKPFLFIMISLHIIISFNLLFSIFMKFSLVLAAITILLYTFAILINVIKDNRISCGCKGMVGNKTITWNTVWKNLMFVSGIILLYFFEPRDFNLTFVFYFLVYLEIYIFFMLYKEFTYLNKKVME